MKLDTKFYGEIYKAKDLSRIPDDEYVVFLVKDTAFAMTLPFYLEKCIELGCDQEQIDAVKALLERVDYWREKNKDRIKIPDAKGEILLKTDIAD